MEQYIEAFVGIDTAKNKHAYAIADPGRDGEIRYLGEIDFIVSANTGLHILQLEGEAKEVIEGKN